MEHVLWVIFVFERGQSGELLRRICATHPCGTFVAERIDVLALRKCIESGGRTPRERDSFVVFGGVRPPARGDVFERGVSEGERGVLFGQLGDRAAVRLQANIRDVPPRRLPPAYQAALGRNLRMPP